MKTSDILRLLETPEEKLRLLERARERERPDWQDRQIRRFLEHQFGGDGGFGGPTIETASDRQRLNAEPHTPPPTPSGRQRATRQRTQATPEQTAAVEKLGPEPKLADARTSKSSPTKKPPDIRTSRERLRLLATVRAELKIVHGAKRRYTTIDKLKSKHPKFALWLLLNHPEQKALIDEDFATVHYANVLVARKFGISPRTLKYDRKKLRQTDSDTN